MVSFIMTKTIDIFLFVLAVWIKKSVNGRISMVLDVLTIVLPQSQNHKDKIFKDYGPI